MTISPSPSLLLFHDHTVNTPQSQAEKGKETPYPKTILFFKIPTSETSTSTKSLCSRNCRGDRNAPTPAGVPVMTAVPAGIVVPGFKVPFR